MSLRIARTETKLVLHHGLRKVSSLYLERVLAALAKPPSNLLQELLLHHDQNIYCFLTAGLVTKASMLAEFFFALAMLWWEGLRALKIDISS